MTKADFLAGKPFKLNHCEFKFKHTFGDIPMIYNGFVSRDGDNKWISLGEEVWVTKIGTKTVECEILVLGDIVKKKIRFEEMVLIEYKPNTRG